MPFQETYWGPQSDLDLEFLGEVDVLAARTPVVMVAALAQSFAATNDVDAKRVFAARALGEIAQGVETFAILAMAIRDRAERGILETFVLHPMGAPRAAIEALATLQVADDMAGFLKVVVDDLQHDQRRSLPALFGAAHGLARLLTMHDGMVRTFYNKSKHGPVLVRSVREGRPAFGPTPDPTVFVIARNTAPNADDDHFWNAVGVPASAEFMTLMNEGAAMISTSIRLLKGWIRIGLEHHAL